MMGYLEHFSDVIDLLPRFSDHSSTTSFLCIDSRPAFFVNEFNVSLTEDIRDNFTASFFGIIWLSGGGRLRNVCAELVGSFVRIACRVHNDPAWTPFDPAGAVEARLADDSSALVRHHAQLLVEGNTRFVDAHVLVAYAANLEIQSRLENIAIKGLLT